MQITTDTSQIKDLLINAQKILIATRQNPSIDGIGSMLALGDILKKQDKTVTCLSEQFNQEKIAFLPGSDTIQTKLPPKSLIVSIDLKGNPIEKINYETKDGKLDLIITPKQGEISAESIEFLETNLNYDLVVTLGTEELSLLGQIAQIHRQGLEKTAILNIDANAKNSQYGKINFIDETCSSTAEALFSLLTNLGFTVEKEAATALLAGIIEKTQSFKKKVTAQTFATASQLTQLGADLEIINKNIEQETTEQPFIR
ncbi:MAG: hypothetical protein FJ044_05255 [Candidatus Cloacimonetes bacterium]|nr:hypothetical protein [Candidatus Cloacimonadota bacterium]